MSRIVQEVARRDDDVRLRFFYCLQYFSVQPSSVQVGYLRYPEPSKDAGISGHDTGYRLSLRLKLLK
jgi:hypothetical protein